MIGIVVVPDRGDLMKLTSRQLFELTLSIVRHSVRCIRRQRSQRGGVATLFVPLLIREVPRLSLAKAIALAGSIKIDETYLGLQVLFRRYPNEPSTWDTLIGYFVQTPPERIPKSLIYHLAHIPWHGDIAYSGEAITSASREYARTRLASITRPDILKLLQLIDDNGIARGTLGQSVEAIISSLPNVDAHLAGIASDDANDLTLCESAALILAMHDADESASVLSHVSERGSWFAAELLRVIREVGVVNPYA